MAAAAGQSERRGRRRGQEQGSRERVQGAGRQEKATMVGAWAWLESRAGCENAVLHGGGNHVQNFEGGGFKRNLGVQKGGRSEYTNR